MELFKIFGVLVLKHFDKVNHQLDDVRNKAKETADDTEKSTSKFSGFMKGLGKGVLVATGAVATGGIALVKSVSSSYGALQQSIGGIETLFGDSAGKVIENANNAFTTAGISANDYMQQVTSFSASLLQALGGDTEKACDSADMAIRDMADNANKMGTSMEMIQNAYQGFSKQNYTMLDNLKLGYGGTKTEMERLLKDAQKISGVKYDMSNLNDVYQAIHVIQEEMGITGTTALEAGETIEGSFNSLGASWQNFLAGLGDPNADMQKIVGNLAKSINGAVKNVIPIINNMVAVLPTVMNAMIDAISSMLPTLIKTFTELITKVIDAIVKLLPQIIPAIVQCLITVAQAIIENLPLIVDAGIQLILALAKGIMEALPQLIPIILQVIQTIINDLVSNLPLIIETGVQLILALINGIVDAIPVLIDMLPQIIETIIEVLVANLPMIIEAGIKIIIALSIGLIQAIPQLIMAIPKIIIAIVKGFASGVGKMFTTGDTLMASLFKGISGGSGKVLKFIKNLWNSISEFFKGGINSVISLLNYFIDALNRISFNVPEWVPILGGMKFGFNIGKINYLAKGGVLTGPTLLDYNPQSNSATIGGEKGEEAIAPISVLQNYISSAVQQETGNLASSIDRLYDMLNDNLSNILNGMDKDLVLDTGTLIGSTIKTIDRQLGARSMKKLRGNV